MNKPASRVSTIMIHTIDPIRLVTVLDEGCISIRIGNIHIAVFHEKGLVPEVLHQDEREAAAYERREEFEIAKK